MKLELITKDKKQLEETKKYCKINKLKFIDQGIKFQLGIPEYLFDVIGTREQIEKYEDDHIIVY